MLSVIIATLDCERALVATLAALIPGAMEGLVSEVLVADAGSRDETAAVAEVAGCNLRVLPGPLGRRLGDAAAAARAPWLLFLRPGTVLAASWTTEVRRFLEDSPARAQAGVFRRGTSAQPPPREAFSLLAAALGATPRPDQGLIISKRFYQEIAGHSERAADPETDLLRRIGRRRIVRLATVATTARPRSRDT